VLDIGFNHMSMASFTETGGSMVGLEVLEARDTFVSAPPSIEFGGTFMRPGAKYWWRPYVRLAYLGLGFGGAPELEARFVGSPDDAEPFIFVSGLEQDYGQMAFGIDVMSSKRNVFRLEANAILGSATTEYGFEGSWSYFFK